VIHNFSKKTIVDEEELKLINPGTGSTGRTAHKPVTTKRANNLEIPTKPATSIPHKDHIVKPITAKNIIITSKTSKNTSETVEKHKTDKTELIIPTPIKAIELEALESVIITTTSTTTTKPTTYNEFKKVENLEIREVSDNAKRIAVRNASDNYDCKVYKLGDVFTGRRVLMTNIGIDVGTMNIVIAYKNSEGEVDYLSEVNGYWIFERATPFIENMLNDANKVRSDGTERSAKWIKMPETNQICVLGKDAEEFAYAKNDTLLRPMAEGGIAAEEEAMTVLASIVQGLLEMAENEVGKFDKEVKIVYCTTAPAINKESNIDYHKRVVDIIISGYETTSNIDMNTIKESHAIVVNDSPDGTGIGISWGAGTVTVSYVKYGIEIYSFSWVGAGDWIDTQVAMRHGYNPEALKTRKKTAKETPTTVAKRKLQIDLSPNIEAKDRIEMDIKLHYDVLINQVIDGIVQGFTEHESEARIDEAINIYMAGGTSSPNGFEQRVAILFEERDPPFEIAEVNKSAKPLYAVAEGCLKAAEMF
jgi:actin-like ATPase involved in cell morphogenesis